MRKSWFPLISRAVLSPTVLSPTLASVAAMSLLATLTLTAVAQDPPATAPAATQPATGASSQPTLVDFKSDENGFAVSYISSWKPQPTDKPFVILKLQPQDGEGELGDAVAVVMLPPVKAAADGKAPTFDELQASVIAEVAAGYAPDVKTVVSTDTTLGGEKARRVILTATAATTGDTVRAVMILAVHKGKGYAVAMASPVQEFGRRRGGFDRLMQTFKFTG